MYKYFLIFCLHKLENTNTIHVSCAWYVLYANFLLNPSICMMHKKFFFHPNSFNNKALYLLVFSLELDRLYASVFFPFSLDSSFALIKLSE